MVLPLHVQKHTAHRRRGEQGRAPSIKASCQRARGWEGDGCAMTVRATCHSTDRLGSGRGPGSLRWLVPGSPGQACWNDHGGHVAAHQRPAAGRQALRLGPQDRVEPARGRSPPRATGRPARQCRSPSPKARPGRCGDPSGPACGPPSRTLPTPRLPGLPSLPRCQGPRPARQPSACRSVPGTSQPGWSALIREAATRARRRASAAAPLHRRHGWRIRHGSARPADDRHRSVDEA